MNDLQHGRMWRKGCGQHSTGTGSLCNERVLQADTLHNIQSAN